MPSSNKKKVTIYVTNDGELANQLWNYISIYAYCLEKGYILDNYAFYEYSAKFNLPVTNLFFEYTFPVALTSDTSRKWSFRRRVLRRLYSFLTSIVLCTRRHQLFEVSNKKREPLYLPPSQHPPEKLKTLEETGCDIIFSGWLFRNPVGIEIYRKEIQEYFRPKSCVLKTIAETIAPLRKQYQQVIGVHVRQGDYKHWLGGQYFLSQKHVRNTLEAYLQKRSLSTKNVCFVVASDGPIDRPAFLGLNVVVSKNGPVEDLFMLSQTDAVIGSNSTFGDFAAYYGNIPHIVITNDPMDWDYYTEKNALSYSAKFFPNKYCTWVHY